LRLVKARQSYRSIIIAHDVGRSRDRSTAVIGGNSPFQPRLLGIRELEELPQKLYGSPRASALATIDRRYNCNALIVADLSNDPTYAEALLETFGPRVIGVQIARSGDGMQAEQRPVKHRSMLIYTIGRTYLLELFHAELQSNQVRFVDGPMSRRAYEQLNGLETEIRESGIVYSCPSGQHDDLGISCAMLAWAARHPHLSEWVRISERSRIIRKPRPKVSWEAWT
jgi:hypothetical protein